MTREQIIATLVKAEKLRDEPFFHEMNATEFDLHEDDLVVTIQRALDDWRKHNVRN